MPLSAKKRIYKSTGGIDEKESGTGGSEVLDEFQDDYVRSKRNSIYPKIKRPSPAAAARSPAKKVGSPGLEDAGLTSDEDYDRRYDLDPVAPLAISPLKLSEPSPPARKSGQRGGGTLQRRPSYSIDPWEAASSEDDGLVGTPGSFPFRNSPNPSECSDDYDDDGREFVEDGDDGDERGPSSRHATFLVPADLHPNMEQREDDIAQLRLLAGQLNADWRGQDFMAPALARRIRDFQFAQEKRRKRYGDERPWGILGLYDHLATIRVDVEWAEDAAWRRANGEPYLSWADFDASKNKGIHRPFFTYFLLLLCSIVFVVSIALNGWIVEPLDVNPMIGPSAQTLIRMGAKDSFLIVNHGDVWRLLSSTVLHAGLVHYFINTLALWFVGKAIETSHGMVAAAILFVVPAIGGTILSAILLPEYITVGASGGIFGLIGACLADITMNWKLLFCDFVTENGKQHRHAMVVVFLLLDIALNCIIGLTPFVDNFTHLGGMVIGLLCGLSTMERLSVDFFGMEENCWSQTKQIVMRFFGLIVSVIWIIITAVILLEGDGQSNPCPSCAWLSCIPFPPGKTEKWWYCDDCGRVTAEIIQSPSLHLQLDCPDGTNVAVGLKSEEGIDRNKLEKELPAYCREYCPDIDFRF